MPQKIIKVNGMHCKSCEVLLEQNLTELKNVKKVKASYKRGEVEINYQDNLDLAAVEQIIQETGYQLGAKTPLPLISKKKTDWQQLSLAALALIILYLLARIFNVGDLGKMVENNYGSLPVVFLIGLTAGVSTCMALVGGLILGISSKYAQTHPQSSAKEKFTPQLFFNLGRILTFFVLGGLIGWLGSLIQISTSVIGFLTILVGLAMLFLGLQLIGVFPRLARLQLTLPKSLSRLLGFNQARQAHYTHRGAIILGGLTFFLPCGFTQAMQLFAISTGNPLTGALTMAIFALGTAPGLLGVGGLTSIVKGKIANYFFKFAGLVILALAFYNISNGFNLTGIVLSASSIKEACADATAACPLFPQASPNASLTPADQTTTDDVQLLQATYTVKDGVTPTQFTVKASQKVRVEVLAQDNGSGCMGSFMIPAFDKKAQNFKKGETVVVEFTPVKAGTYQMTCAMGVPHGTIKVI
jgi:sulfite exporter TauE/SafE/copper chaperone CopZ